MTSGAKKNLSEDDLDMAMSSFRMHHTSLKNVVTQNRPAIYDNQEMAFKETTLCVRTLFISRHVILRRLNFVLHL
jgi:hypothetical protein